MSRGNVRDYYYRRPENFKKKNHEKSKEESYTRGQKSHDEEKVNITKENTEGNKQTNISKCVIS